jgi:hypothetical protein
MDALDLFNLLGFGWLYDRVEHRYGRGAALLVTVAGSVAIIGILVVTIFVVGSVR